MFGVIEFSETKAAEVASALRMTAKDLLEFKIVDDIIKEPIGGAHRDSALTANRIRRALIRHIQHLTSVMPSELLSQRYARYRQCGEYRE